MNGKLKIKSLETEVEIKYNERNVKIVDSYRVKSRREMESVLLVFLEKTGYRSRRSIESWVDEWRFHNFLYRIGMYRNRTADCDLEEKEKWWRLVIYWIFNIF